MVIPKYSSELVKLHIWKENEQIGVRTVAYAFKKRGVSTYAERNTYKFDEVLY